MVKTKMEQLFKEMDRDFRRVDKAFRKAHLKQRGKGEG